MKVCVQAVQRVKFISRIEGEFDVYILGQSGAEAGKTMMFTSDLQLPAGR